MRKHLWITILSVFLILSLMACSSGKDEAKGGPQASDPLDLLTTVWNGYDENEKFAVIGGDTSEENMTDGAPGVFGTNDADLLDGVLGFPAASADKIDGAASLIHMMNANSFTCGAYHAIDKKDAGALAEAVKENIVNREWICGFPDRVVVAVVDDYVVSAFGAEDLIGVFVDKLQAAYPQTEIKAEESLL